MVIKIIKWSAIGFGIFLVVIIALAMIFGPDTVTKTVEVRTPGPTVTQSVPGPTVTETQNVPGPTVTVTQKPEPKVIPQSVAPSSPASPVPVPPSADIQINTVHAGSYCDTIGEHGETVKGTPMVCSLKDAETKPRWRSG